MEKQQRKGRSKVNCCPPWILKPPATWSVFLALTVFEVDQTRHETVFAIDVPVRSSKISGSFLDWAGLRSGPLLIRVSGRCRAAGAEGPGHSGGPLHRLGGVRGLHHGGHGAAPREDHVRRGRPQRHAEACMSVLWGPTRLLCAPCTQSAPGGSASPLHVLFIYSFPFPVSPASLFRPSIFLLVSRGVKGQIEMEIGELAFWSSGCSWPVSGPFFVQGLGLQSGVCLPGTSSHDFPSLHF